MTKRVIVDYIATPLTIDTDWKGPVEYTAMQTFKGTSWEILHKVFKLLKQMESQACQILTVRFK